MISSILSFMTPDSRTQIAPGELIYRKPNSEDGAAIWDLIQNCPPLDENSLYCNILQADHFRDTCIAAQHEDRIVGWISGYRPPREKNTLFIWQVAVHEDARGLGLGKKLMRKLLARQSCLGVNTLKTTITPDNAASWGLFKSFAKDIGGEMDDDPWLCKDAHFDGMHDPEHLITIKFPPRQPAMRNQDNTPKVNKAAEYKADIKTADGGPDKAAG